MKCKLVLLLLGISAVLCMSSCGKAEETTLTGMVISIDGTVVSLQEFDSEMMEMSDEEILSMPSDAEGFAEFESGDFGGSMPTDLPEGSDIPELPADAEVPDFDSFNAEVESTMIDLADAHITVEFDGGKATGSMEDITVGTFLTITLDGDGEATKVVVSSVRGFGS